MCKCVLIFSARCRITLKLDLGTHEPKELGTNEPDHRSQHWLVHCPHVMFVDIVILYWKHILVICMCSVIVSGFQM